MKKELNWGTHTHVMGIINLTPDSFSGDGLGKDDLVIDRALPQAKQMLSDGAEMLDLGAESSRRERGGKRFRRDRTVISVLNAIRKQKRNHPFGDTYKA